MISGKKIVLAWVAIVIVGATVYVFAEDARRKKLNNTVVPLQYAIDAMKKQS